MSPTSESLEILLAEREILRTFHRFFRMADLDEFAQIGDACFTADALIEYKIMPGPIQRFRGKDEFVRFMTQGGQRPRGEPRVAHVIGQVTIDWVDDTAHVEAYATVYHWAATRDALGRHRPADWTVVGLVQDQFTPRRRSMAHQQEKRRTCRGPRCCRNCTGVMDRSASALPGENAPTHGLATRSWKPVLVRS